MKRLYWQNTYLMTCSATITAIGQDEHGHWLRLDQTIFHPQGGGQPSDEGTINGITVVKLIDVRDLDQINHYVEDINPFQVNETVTLQIDKEKRLEHAALHTAGHITAGVLRTSHQYKEQVSANHFPKQAKVTFKLDGNPIEKTAIEAQTNAIIAEAKKIYEKYDENGVRYIDIDGLCSDRCSGTHVSDTSKIIEFMVRKIETKKGLLTVGYNAKYHE